MKGLELAAYSMLTFEQKCAYWQANPDALEKQIKRWKRIKKGKVVNPG
jgi:hypothetical protein